MASVPRDALVGLVRGPALATAACYALWPAWRALFEYSQLSDRMFFTLTTTTVHAALYFGLNSFFLLCDTLGWLSEYKLPRSPAQVPSRALLLRTVLPQVVLQLVVLPLLAYYALFPLYVSMGAPPQDAPLPSTPVVFGSLLGCLLFNAWGFYAAHRVLHEFPSLYRAIHKQHHEYTGSVGFAAEYAHPVEALLANTIPTLGFGILAGIHPLVFCIWFAWRLEETYEAHSGYNCECSRQCDSTQDTSFYPLPALLRRSCALAPRPHRAPARAPRCAPRLPPLRQRRQLRLGADGRALRDHGSLPRGGGGGRAVGGQGQSGQGALSSLPAPAGGAARGLGLGPSGSCVTGTRHGSRSVQKLVSLVIPLEQTHQRQPPLPTRAWQRPSWQSMHRGRCQDLQQTPGRPLLHASLPWARSSPALPSRRQQRGQLPRACLQQGRRPVKSEV